VVRVTRTGAGADGDETTGPQERYTGSECRTAACHRDRGQLVLIAAIALAVALVPLLLALTQLGYHEDIRPGSTTDFAGETERTLERGLTAASSNVTTYGWSERKMAVEAVRSRLAPTLDTLERAGLTEGTAIHVDYNGTHAANWMPANCPAGPDRQFGNCEMRSGIVLQERSGLTHVLGAAFDVAVTTPEGTVSLRTVVTV